MYKILVFEEKNIFSRSLKEILTLEGFEVINVTEDSEKMSEYLKAQSPDLILLDKDFRFSKSGISPDVNSLFNIPLIYITQEQREYSGKSKIANILKNSFEKLLDNDLDKNSKEE